MLQIRRRTSGIFRGCRARARNQLRPSGTTKALLFVRREGKPKCPCVATFSRRLRRGFRTIAPTFCQFSPSPLRRSSVLIPVVFSSQRSPSQLFALVRKKHRSQSLILFLLLCRGPIHGGAVFIHELGAAVGSKND